MDVEQSQIYPPALLSQLEQRHYGPRVGMARFAQLPQALRHQGQFLRSRRSRRSYPWMLPELVAAGHEVGLHGYFHELVTQTRER